MTETKNSPTSFWSHPDGHALRVLYNSPASWGKTMMADIDLYTNGVNLVCGDDSEKRHLISRFNLECVTPGSGYRRMSLTGCDRTLIKEALRVLENHGNKYGLLKIHVKAALGGTYRYTHATGLLSEEVRKQINRVYSAESDGLPKDAFYCGTTSDLDLRMEWHRCHDFGIAGDRVHAWVFADIQDAEMIRQWAGGEGYDTAEGQTPVYEDKRKAVIVYLLRKGTVFRQ